MNAPDFWYKQKNDLSFLEKTLQTALTPFSCLYNAVTQSRLKNEAGKSAAKVICVGNLTAGGGGKTPTVRALSTLLSHEKLHILLRGYKGKLSGPVLVDPSKHTAVDVGDEALLLAQDGFPVWISADRYKGAQAAEQAGATTLIMDDGFQNPTLHKDFSLIVVDGTIGFGNGKIIPAGPLRESVSGGLKRANAVLILGEDTANIETIATKHNKPVFHADKEPVLPDIAGQKIVGFCGLARPEKFKQSLEQSKAALCDFVAFPDHHNYTQADFDRLKKLAEVHDATLVTTDKDAVKIPETEKQGIRVATIDIVFRNPDELEKLLA